MPRTDRWPERIGAVFLPEAGTVEVAEDLTPRAERSPSLEQGCYTVSLRWADAQRYSLAHVGTLRVEQLGPRVRLSGDLYRDQPTPGVLADPRDARRQPAPPADEAADTGGTIPIYPRPAYYSYLRGVGAGLSSTAPEGSDDSVVLEFEEFVYEQPAEGFNGRFEQGPPRGLRFVLAPRRLRAGTAEPRMRAGAGAAPSRSAGSPPTSGGPTWSCTPSRERWRRRRRWRGRPSRRSSPMPAGS